MYNSPRAATVTADQDAVVWSLNRVTFRNILANATAMQSNKIVESLKKVDLLKNLNDHQFSLLADAVSLVTYTPNDTIIKKGEEGRVFYMIKTGSVLCTELASNAKNQKLGAGDYFGERSLLTDEPRAATVVAETACTVMALDRHDFEEILGGEVERRTAGEKDGWAKGRSEGTERNDSRIPRTIISNIFLPRFAPCLALQI